MLVQPLRWTTKVLRIHEWWAFMAFLFANEIDKIREESQSLPQMGRFAYGRTNHI